MSTSACCGVLAHFDAELKDWLVNRTLRCNLLIQWYDAPFVAQLLKMTDRCLTLHSQHSDSYQNV